MACNCNSNCNCNCNNNLPRVSVTVPTAADTANITLTTTQTFIAPKTEVILNISDISNLMQDAEAIISIEDSTNTLPFQDKRGFNVRADRIVSRAMNMPGGLPDNTTMALRVLIATDPARVVCLTPLRRSAAVRPATTAGTATGTGINLD